MRDAADMILLDRDLAFAIEQYLDTYADGDEDKPNTSARLLSQLRACLPALPPGRSSR